MQVRILHEGQDLPVLVEVAAGRLTLHMSWSNWRCLSTVPMPTADVVGHHGGVRADLPGHQAPIAPSTAPPGQQREKRARRQRVRAPAPQRGQYRVTRNPAQARR